MHVGIANPHWRGKRSRHSRRMRNPQFYVSGKRSMDLAPSFESYFCNLSVIIATVTLHVVINNFICHQPLDISKLSQHADFSVLWKNRALSMWKTSCCQLTVIENRCNWIQYFQPEKLAWKWKFYIFLYSLSSQWVNCPNSLTDLVGNLAWYLSSKNEVSIMITRETAVFNLR